MKLFKRRKSAKAYSATRHHSRRHLSTRPYIIPIAALVVSLAVVAGVAVTHKSPTLRPSTSHVVFLFDEGKQQTLDTKAATVGDLVDKLPLDLIPQDVVEPSLNTPIFEDNFRINIYRARPVTVVDGATKTVTLTAQKSARTVAQQAGIKINSEDIATFAQGDLKDNIIGEQVIISRATPVQLNLFGTEVSTYTLAKTVGGMLKEKHINLTTGESVDPVATTPIALNMQIFVLSKGTQLVTIKSAIPAPTQDVGDSTLSFGATVVRQAGSPGEKLDTYLITTQQGAETGRQLIQEAIIDNPVPQIVAIGSAIDIDSDKTAVMKAAGIGSGDFPYVNYIVSNESGWCYTKWQGEIGYCPGSYTELHDPSSGYGFGLCQSTPAIKMSSAGSDWATNPVTQLKWCNGYASRYGGWGGAYNHWLNYHSW